MIENGIACFDVAQQVDQRDLVGLRTRKRAQDEVEIGSGKPRPTIRPDHRDFIMRDTCAYGKSDILATDEHRFTQMNQEPRKGSSEIEGKAARVAAKKRGQRLSFNPGTQTEFTELTGLRR